VSSSFYQLALYKLGWTFYKQEFYEEGLDKFVALLDYKVSVGYDFEQTADEPERKRMEDTFRVISLSFSYLGGADVVVDFFARQGRRNYEDRVYGNLGEYYYAKRRYADATATYSAFVSRNPLHRMSPHFDMRVIEINMAGGFPTLVIDSKKAFATHYGLKAEYWRHFEPGDYPEVLGYLKTNLQDLANHYHALYQSPKHRAGKPANFAEALHWYREYLASFPTESESPAIHYQLADLLLENRSFADAAVEYEKIAYDYPGHEKSATAGYAAVFARREQLGAVPTEKQDPVKRQVVASSLKFAETFPQHEKAAIVLGAAADDLYAMQAYEQALAAASKLIASFPATDQNVLRSAWLVVGHASYELQGYSEAEQAYVKVLALLPKDNKSRASLVDNLAAAIYKQGEAANAVEDYRLAAEHLLRVGRMAPTSKIRPTAEYDAATALIQLKDWGAAATVLTGFRNTFSDHELQPEVTKKIAFVYRQDGKAAQAAAEYERIEAESDDDEIRREALQVAAELYIEAGNKAIALQVYRRYVDNFPRPVEVNLETRNKITEFLKAEKDQKGYLEQLRQIVAIDAAAGAERTERTRYLAAKAALVLAENTYERFLAIKLVKPLEENLQKKKSMMKESIKRFNRLIEYESGEHTAAATFYLAEIYAHFSKALMASERPELTFDDYTIQPGDNLIKIAKRSKCDITRIVNANNLKKSSVIVAGKKLKIPRGLYPEELEQYELALEEQAYPFEERAISVHESNLELIARGIYNEWVEKSLQKLAGFMPARYDRPEEESAILVSLDSFTFEIHRPVPAEPPVDEPVATAGEEQAAREESAIGEVPPAEEPVNEPQVSASAGPSAAKPEMQ
jgi:tetratricopeptide (TPR) repeat protein/LysM repeat protein